MIVNDSEAAARLGSPLNLINRLSKLGSDSQRKNAMSLFIKPSLATPLEKITKEEAKEVIVTFNPFKSKSSEPQALVPVTEQSAVRLDDISIDHDSKIKLGLAHDKALQLLTDSVTLLSAKLDDVSAAKLPSVIAAASRTVESIRRERNEANKNSKGQDVHYHFYTPQQKPLESYEVIEVQ